MSRCFPFPPPGYDKKTHVDDIGVLAKEKKQRKDKKDKEKKEGKDKKDRGTSKENHNEKKDQKEKHKDKKDKEKEKKHHTSNEKKKSEVQRNCLNGENLESAVLQNNNGSENSKYVWELARRIGNEEKATGRRQIVQNIKVGDEGKINNSVGSKYLQESAERIRDEGKGPTNQIFQKINKDTDEGKIEICRRIADRNGVYLSKSKEKGRDRKDDDRMVSGNRDFAVARSVDHKFFKGSSKPLEKKDVGNDTVGKQKREYNKEGDDKIEKHKNRDQDKNSISKDKSRDKETKKKEENAKEMSELSQERDKFMEGGPKLKDTSKIKPSDVFMASDRIPAKEVNLGKRNEPEKNGFFHENGNKSNRLQRSMDALHMTTENGTKFELFQTNSQRADTKGFRIQNGFIEIREQKVFPLPKTAEFGEFGEASAKPPYPDSKFLIQILSVTKKDKLPEFDEQEWLFGTRSNHRSSKKPKMDSFETDETVQVVWDQALRIEPADISALPYVLPY